MIVANYRSAKEYGYYITNLIKWPYTSFPPHFIYLSINMWRYFIQWGNSNSKYLNLPEKMRKEKQSFSNKK